MQQPPKVSGRILAEMNPAGNGPGCTNKGRAGIMDIANGLNGCMQDSTHGKSQ